MNKNQWESLKKRLQKLATRRRILELRKLLRKEKNKKIRIEIESELTKFLSIIPRSRKPQILITPESSPIETTAAETPERIRPELLRSLENILLTTPTPQIEESENKNYGPSAKYGIGSYQTFKYEEQGAKYKPATDRMTMQALTPIIEYKSLAETSLMLEKTPEAKKLEEPIHYKRKKQEN